jgi:Group II intron, maturase-specific domain
MASIRGMVRQRTDRRYASADLGDVVGSLNPVLRGWGNYFRRGNSPRKFHAVDMYVAQRMARLASIKHGLRGINWTDRFNYDWFQTLGVYRLTGTVGQRGAHA